MTGYETSITKLKRTHVSLLRIINYVFLYVTLIKYKKNDTGTIPS